MPRANNVLSVVVLFISLGLSGLASAAAASVTVTAPVQFEIENDGRISGKVGLRVGTVLIVESADGEYLNVRIHNLRGRVLAQCTDYSNQGPAVPADGLPPRVTPPSSSTPIKAVKPTPEGPALSHPPPLADQHPEYAAGGSYKRRTSAVLFVPFFVMAALSLVTMVSYWRLFVKAGKPGWAILVPIYNLVIMQRISGKPVWWLFLYFVPVVNLLVCITTLFGIARNFGKGMLFGLGLFFFPFVFVPVLAFGKAEFIGAP